MKAIIEREDSDGIKSTFTIIGANENDIDNQVAELKSYSSHNEDYEKYRIIKYQK